MTFTQSFEQLKREHPTWDASQITREMQKRSIASRRRKGRWQGQNRPQPQTSVTYWWQDN